MKGYICSTCGKYHDELPLSFGCAAPELWYRIPEAERDSRALLSADECVIDDKYFFVRGQLLLPIVGTSKDFVWLVWVSLSKKNFVRSFELWTSEGREKEPPYFGWLQSSLPYNPSTLSLETSVYTRAVGLRPLIELQPSDHPLSVEQRMGITPERARQIAEQALHASGT